jgi:diamine N-acetyltransferase
MVKLVRNNNPPIVIPAKAGIHRTPAITIRMRSMVLAGTMVIRPTGAFVNDTVKLDGEFVALRLMRVDDAALTFPGARRARARLLNAGAATVEQQAAWIASRPGSEYNFIIELKDGRAIGMLSLVGINKVNRHAETGRFLIGDEGRQRRAGRRRGHEAAVRIRFRQTGPDPPARHGRLRQPADGEVAEVPGHEGRRPHAQPLLHRRQMAGRRCARLLADEARTQSFPRMNALIAAARRSHA